MNPNEVHTQGGNPMNPNEVHTQGNVPFSWENKPGVSKTTNQGCSNEGHHPLRLPPPPCLKEKTRFAVHDIRMPLPPCTFQLQPLSSSRSSSRKGSFKKVEDDPFMLALKECTKSSTGKGKLSKNDHSHVSSGLKKKGLFNKFSCQHSCSVEEDNFVKICQPPYKKNEES